MMKMMMILIRLSMIKWMRRISKCDEDSMDEEGGSVISWIL